MFPVALTRGGSCHAVECSYLNDNPAHPEAGPEERCPWCQQSWKLNSDAGSACARVQAHVPHSAPSTCQAVGCPLEDPVMNTAVASALVWLTVQQGRWRAQCSASGAVAEQGPGDTATRPRGIPTSFTSQGRCPVNSTFKLKLKGGTLLKKLTLGKGKYLETARMTSPRSALQHMGGRRRERGRGAHKLSLLQKPNPWAWNPKPPSNPGRLSSLQLLY